jgi:uncharacterized repeat protein (TIGR03803 family)
MRIDAKRRPVSPCALFRVWLQPVSCALNGRVSRLGPRITVQNRVIVLSACGWTVSQVEVRNEVVCDAANAVFLFLHQSMTVLALTATLVAAADAQAKFKILHTVPGGLFSGLTFDAKGNLYGVTGGGGVHKQGTIFELTHGAQG